MYCFRFTLVLAGSIWLFGGLVYGQAPRKLILGLSSIGGGIDTLYVTKKIGAFKKNGLDVDLVLFQGGTQALQALLSGDVKVVSGGGGRGGQSARIKGAGDVRVAASSPPMPSRP